MDYYTYAYLREDNTPYYIGKGKGYRINDRNKNVFLPPKERRIYLKHFENEEDAYKHEIYMIDILPNLRNLTAGGEGFKGNHTEKTREGMRQRGKQRGNSVLLKGNPSRMRGMKHSEETRKKMSLAQKGRNKPPRTEEHCKNLSKSCKGRVHTEEYKKRHSEIMKQYYIDNPRRKKQ